MKKSAGIVGAGIMGRMVALELVESGWTVTLFDRDLPKCPSSCSLSAAGMLANFCELEHTEALINRLGQSALVLWPRVIENLETNVFYQQEGTIVVAHPEDHRDLSLFAEKIYSKSDGSLSMEAADKARLQALEPDLPSRFQHGYFFPKEGQLDNRELLRGLEATLLARGTHWQFQADVDFMEAHRIVSHGQSYTFDRVIDCRGLGAKENLKGLRGVRGELIIVEATEVNLHRPIRLLHPRYPLYVVPRPRNIYLIGATTIESDNLKPLSVRSALELLSAAYSLHPGFAEGHIKELVANARPAFNNNLPRILNDRGIIRVNGLYRHGFLLAPVLAQWVGAYLNQGRVPPEAQNLWEPYEHEYFC